MGFDNECILNIQSLAGEYFCPVCRLLVYPNEALQSQCTHLYCKPCLAYVVSTTRACPYDGYLVTEADSKPLLESNKALAESIGKITVHCLYHRSGCTWQGPLSECTGHCSGCAFGNSPVVCNRCGIQIVHRQVQEHAQNCPGVQPQAQQVEGTQDAASTGNPATVNQGVTASQAGTTTSQTQTQSTPIATPGLDPSQQANASSQAQAVTQAAVMTSDQWYQQQQQQYQQYYQQYSGYDPYYQQYYPYQQQGPPQYQQQNLQVQAPQVAGQQVYMQSQPQAQPQLQPSQPQPQAHTQGHPQSSQPIQTSVPTQPQKPAQVNQQPQTHPTVPPHSQLPSQVHPPAQGHPPPQVQPYPQTQSHQQHVQMPQYQQPQPQLQSQFHPQHQSQAQYHSQVQPQTLVQTQSHPQMHPSQSNQPLNPNFQPQTQHPSASAHTVTGHHSYPQPQPHQQMLPGAPQQPMHVAQGNIHTQVQHSVQMQSPYSQQPPIRPPASHAVMPNQQQPGLLPSPGPVPQQQVHPHVQQPSLPIHQRPVMQPAPSPMSQQYLHQQPLSGQQVGTFQNQMHQQGPFVQQQLPAQSQLRPQGPPHSYQQYSHAYPQPQQNVPSSQGIHSQPSQNPAGRPIMPAHGAQSQQYPQSPAGVVKPLQLNLPSSNQTNMFSANKQVQFSSEQQSEMSSQPTSEVPGDDKIGKSVTEQGDSSFQRTANRDANDLGAGSALGADIGKTITLKSEPDVNSNDKKPMSNTGGENGEVSTSMKGVAESSQKLGTERESHAFVSGDSLIKKTIKEETTEDQKDIPNVVPRQVQNFEDNKIKDGLSLKTPPSLESGHGEEHSGKLQKDKTFSKGPEINEFRNLPPSSQVQPGLSLQPSHSAPSADQGRTQLPPLDYGPNTPQQRPIAPPLGPPMHTQAKGPLPSHIRPQGPGHMGHLGQGPAPPENLPPGSFVRGPPFHAGASGMSQGDSIGGPPLGTPPYGPKSQLGQHYMDGRRPDPGMHSSNIMRMNGPQGFDSAAFGLQDGRLKPMHDERLNPFSSNPARCEEDLKQFSMASRLDAEPALKFGSNFASARPFERGPHGFGMDVGPEAREKGPHGLNYDPVIGHGPSRFLPPYRPGGAMHPDGTGERAVGLHEDGVGRPDFLGPVPGYGRPYVDDFASRSPGREYGIPPHGFRGHHGDDIDGRRFNGRFPGHLRRGEFEGPDNLPMGEHLRGGDLVGQDIPPSHLRRGELLGPHDLPTYLRFGEPVGFGTFSGHERMGGFGRPGNFRHPRLGEPGFRSSFSGQGFPNDGGMYTGDMNSFENMRKRKPTTTGWCRICKVDCETVEGLDLHSQTREHQKMAMDMVAIIKQNAKKHKLNNSDRTIQNDASKLRNASFEGRGNKG